MYVNPYEGLNKKGQWLKSNFHTHSGTGSNTCGQNSIPDVVEAYKEAGYKLLCISNHDIFTDCSSYTDDDIKLINGFEFSATPHMLFIGGKSLILGDHRESAIKAVDEGAFVILCHPNWQHRYYWTYEKLDEMTGYTGIEVISMLIYRLNGSGKATNTWDHLLSQGKIVYGFGNDDFHRWMDLGRSYTCIYSASADEKDIKSAVADGCFYAATGIYLDSFKFENDVISLGARFEKESHIKNFTYRFVGDGGRLLYEAFAETASYKMNGESYVRAEVYAESGAMLFTQPVYDAAKFRKP